MRTLTWTWLALACAALSLTPGLAQEGEDPGSAPSGGGETGEVSPAEGDEGTSEEALGEEDAEETGDVDTVEDELVEEDPGPDPTDIVFWEAHQTYEGALLAGLMYQDTHGPFSWFTREVGTPPEGGVLRAADYNWYMGGGRLLDVYAITPFETDQAGGVSFRQYGLGDFRAGWTTFEYNSFPIETHSQWKASDYRLRYLGSDLIGVNLGRQHLAHYGVREFGQIQGET
ncbi:MAG TPA: hypothetical protein VEI97_08975, partial [bacterium]|nr:hypothetical protein [bacterium]